VSRAVGGEVEVEIERFGPASVRYPMASSVTPCGAFERSMWAVIFLASSVVHTNTPPMTDIGLGAMTFEASLLPLTGIQSSL